jgi:hypothetical protein
MSVITGLKNIRQVMDKPKSEGVKGRWLKLDDGQSVKIRFLNELDQDSPFYNEKAGSAIVVAEHTNPKDYKRKGICTINDEGRCFGCEMHRRDPKSGWRARLRYYTNLLVDDGTEQYVAIWSQSVGPKVTSTNTIFEYAGDAGSVSNLIWRLKRNGTGTDTNYVLLPLNQDTEPFDQSTLETFPLLETAVRQVAYADQENFYMGLLTDNASLSTNAEW